MKPPARPNLKAQVLADLDSDKEVIIESKYIPLIWGSEERLASWCESWNLDFQTRAGSIMRERYSMKFPIYWLEIKRRQPREELDTPNEPDEFTPTHLTESDLDETDAGL